MLEQEVELWELFDENRKNLNKTIQRGTKLLENEFHIGVYIWVINDKKELLLTLRHPNKRFSPNNWECSGRLCIGGRNK